MLFFFQNFAHVQTIKNIFGGLSTNPPQLSLCRLKSLVGKRVYSTFVFFSHSSPHISAASSSTVIGTVCCFFSPSSSDYRYYSDRSVVRRVQVGSKQSCLIFLLSHIVKETHFSTAPPVHRIPCRRQTSDLCKESRGIYSKTIISL